MLIIYTEVLWKKKFIRGKKTSIKCMNVRLVKKLTFIMYFVQLPLTMKYLVKLTCKHHNTNRFSVLYTHFHNTRLLRLYRL